MSLMAVAYPILPGKTTEWRAFMADLNGPRHREFADSRQRAGVHERTFLQSTPKGDMVVVTLEGTDPLRSFGKMISSTDAFTTWFLERVKSIHGMDLTQPVTGSPSQQVVDSEALAAVAR